MPPQYGAVDPTQRPARINGCSPPMTQNQILFLVGNSVATAAFYLSVGGLVLSRPGDVPPLAHPELLRGVVTLHACLACTGFLCWLYVELHDPSLPSIFGDCLPTTRKWTAAKYVSEHRKPIEGLDHFCAWLNVAIARSNYVPFFVLTCCGVIQYAVQAIFAALCLTAWHSDLVYRTSSPDDPDALVAHVGAVVLAFGSIGMGFPFAMLLAFHVTLLQSGETTYSYIQNAQKREFRARKERAAASAAADSERGGGGASSLEMTPVVGEKVPLQDDKSRFGDRSPSPPGSLDVGNSDASEMFGGAAGDSKV